jgi:hypothetical protein
MADLREGEVWGEITDASLERLLERKGLPRMKRGTMQSITENKKKGEKEAPVERGMRGPGGKGGPVGPNGGPGGGGKEWMGAGLTEEEGRRIREVLAQVWQDPELLAAKEKVKMATDEYREVLQAAVRRVDPTAEKLMAKMHEMSRTMAMRNEHDAMRRRLFGKGGMGGPLGPGLHEFLGRLSEEDREIFLAAREQAEELEVVKAMREEMRSVEDADERVQFMTRSRDLLLAEMVKIDERVEGMLAKMQPRGGSGQAGGGPGRSPGGGPGEKLKGEGQAEAASPDGAGTP